MMSIIDMESKRISVGDTVTVKRWKNIHDRSYIGELFKVLSIDPPFVCAERLTCRIITRPAVFSTDEVELKKLSKEFTDAVLEGS